MLPAIGARAELPELASAYIRDYIVKQNLGPGERIPTEAELVSALGVSRSTVREAVKMLVAENVIEVRRGKGTFVSSSPGVNRDPLGLAFADRKTLLHDLLETRLLFEPQIARLAAGKASPEHKEALQAVLREFAQCPELSPLHAQLDIQFHTILAQSTRNDVLCRVMPIICESIIGGYQKTVAIQGSHRRAMECHRSICQAVCAGDGEAAAQAVRQHIHSTAADADIPL